MEALLTKTARITGVRKAAVLLVALGAEASAEVLKRLTPDEVERVTAQVSAMRNVEPETMQYVLDEFHRRIESESFDEPAGIDLARAMLDRAMGTEKAKEIVSRLGEKPASKPFATVRTIDPTRLLPAIQDEHPQTVALVISYLPPIAAAALLTSLPAALQPEVAERIATLEPAPADVIHQVERIILDRLNHSSSEDVTAVGGAGGLVDILNQVDRATERTVLEGLTSSSPILADAVRARMFAFEDVIKLDDRVIQMILREVASEDLRLALKGSDETVRDAIFKNMSERAAETLRDDLEVMGKVRLKDVESAQKNIVGVVRRLQETGDVVLGGAGEDETIG